MNAAFAWPGGKRALTPTLLKLLPPHALYVEVFAGSAKLLFAKEPSKCEILNDLNGDVTNFFRVVKHRPAELTERFELECVHAGRFRELLAANPQCEMDRAHRFAYLAWYSFGAKGEHFAKVSAKNLQGRRSLAEIRALLTRVAERLAAVSIDQCDFAEILARYDRKDALFYLDPPYVDFQNNARYDALDVKRRDELFRILSKLRGRFVLSFDDHPEIRKRVRSAGFHSLQVKVRYTLAGASETRRENGELVITNFATTLEKPS